MNTAADEMQQRQIQQLQSQKVIKGLNTGIELLEDRNVVAPIAMHEGLTDLKWLLRGLLSGQFSIDLSPVKEPVKEPIVGEVIPKKEEG